ncbi:Pentatricopeptide repeat-containing protein [Acorus gramineus]|uniref:Pentatricopeptide repeat-containing protein n=1 Tax=Acorus gramineus TaxID=55184 RepID=A0AAV9ALU7_ACOGR|nr:Pentatricopeptide repeat-containing protein [Acorus gramineus]
MFFSRTRSLLRTLTNHSRSIPLSPLPLYSSLSPPTTDDVNELCRVLSDHRSPHHDLESALSPFSSRVSSSLVEQVLKRCRNLGVSAHRFFFWAEKSVPNFTHSTHTYQLLVDVLGASREFPLMWVFMFDTKDDVGRRKNIHPKLFRLIFTSYCKAKLPSDAIRAFHRMPDFGLTPNVDDLHQLLFCLCKNGFAKHAQRFFEEQKPNYPIDPKTYTILINGWGDAGNADEAMRLFDEMTESGCSLDIVAYNALILCMCKCGKIDSASRLLKELRVRGLKPDASAYAPFVRAACEVNDVHAVVRVLERMRRYGLVLNVYTYNCVVKLYCRSDMVDEAYGLLDDMIRAGAKPDTWSYNSIMAVHCGRCEVNMAMKLLKRMDEDSCLPDKHTYNMLLKMLIYVGRFERAEEVWEGMERCGFHPSVTTYSVVVHGLCMKKGKLGEACRYFERMIDEGIPPYVCTCVILRDRLLRTRLTDRVKVLMEKMSQSTSCSIRDLACVMEVDDRWHRKCGHLIN